MKVVVIILSIIAFATCLVVGIQAGNSSNHPTASPATDTPNPLISPSQQRTLLLIFVDDLTLANPRLEALWLTVYRPDLLKFTLLPLYPNPSGAENPAAPDLSKSFLLTDDRKPANSFNQALSTYRFDWNGYVIFDRSSLRDTVDWMQGIQLGGKTVTGSAALSSLIPADEDPAAAVRSQQRLIEAVCLRTSHLPIEANWIGLAASFGAAHLSTNLSMDTLISDWKTMMSGASAYTCEVDIP